MMDHLQRQRLLVYGITTLGVTSPDQIANVFRHVKNDMMEEWMDG